MRRAQRETWHLVVAAILSISLVALLGFLTNTLDIHKFSWDFRYYIGMAQHGLQPPLASPFAYRYVTPLLAGALSRLAGTDIEAGFRALAYVGAFLQLFGIFVFTRWLARSTLGAYVAMFATAFSLFNVKFLMFDVYRPDHLAYPFILLQSYFALKRRFWPLLVSTLLASQIREFNVIPLMAYLGVLALERRHGAAGTKRREVLGPLLISAVSLGAAILIPRLIIPVAEDYQMASPTRDGILRILIAPLVLSRDANFAYTLLAYVMPVLILGGVNQISSVLRLLRGPTGSYLWIYSVFVLAFSFLGGTDFFRFATFLFMPQVILLAMLAQRTRPAMIAFTLGVMLVFNRIWLPFPMNDAVTYVDFYGGWGTQFDAASALRLLECLAFIGLGYLVRRSLPPVDGAPVSTAT